MGLWWGWLGGTWVGNLEKKRDFIAILDLPGTEIQSLMESLLLALSCTYNILYNIHSRDTGHKVLLE